MPDQAKYIALEGIDGCGKSTQQNLLAEHLKSKGLEVLCLREPGSTKLAEDIRHILLHGDAIDPRAEALLFSAARAQLIEEVIRPAIAQGKWVISDRSFWSTLAYQGYGRGQNLEMLYQMSRLAVGGLEPDLCFVLDLEPSQCQMRAKDRGPLDRIEAEGLQFQELVAQGYRHLARQYPEKIRLVPAQGEISTVTGNLLKEMR
jgi:dTMP kinase